METSTGKRSALHRPEVAGLLESLHRKAKSDLWKVPSKVPALAAGLLQGKSVMDVFRDGAAKDLFLTISPEQGRFLYLVGRSIQARTVVEFGTSFGVSTIYLAASVADNGGGKVIGTELEPSKAEVATRHLAQAGFSDVAEVRVGDAMETLKAVEGPIDMVLLDGWKDLYMPVLELVKPRLRKGAVVLADNIFTFKKSLKPFTAYLQSGRNGFQSTTLSISDGFEFAVYEGG